MEYPTLPLAEIVLAHQAGIWRYLRYLGASDAQADDLTQETFLAVMERPFEQRSPAQTFGYLRTVARHKFLVLRRREGRTVALDEMEVADEVWNRLSPGGGNHLLDALDDCLEHVNGRAREAIDMHYRDGQSREKIAAALGLAPDGVKTLLRRTRAALRDCVERRTQESS